jgi:hypothetical protein
MRSSWLFLLAGVLSAIVLVGYLLEQEPQSLFGTTVNIWVIRLAYLVMTLTYFGIFFERRKIENS